MLKLKAECTNERCKREFTTNNGGFELTSDFDLKTRKLTVIINTAKDSPDNDLIKALITGEGLHACGRECLHRVIDDLIDKNIINIPSKISDGVVQEEKAFIAKGGQET